MTERIPLIAPHPLARLRLSHCRIPVRQRLGDAGQGFKIAMRTLDVFRTSVAGAALGFARSALDHALYRDIRALRIYEGATEVQQLIIGRDVLKRGA